MFVVLYSREDS